MVDIGVLVSKVGAGAIGILIKCVDVTDGGATDDSDKEIGVCVDTGCSILSDFNNVPFRLIVGGAGTSSTWCILYENTVNIFKKKMNSIYFLMILI